MWPISTTIHALLRGDDDGQLLCPYLPYRPQPPSTSLNLPLALTDAVVTGSRLAYRVIRGHQSELFARRPDCHMLNNDAKELRLLVHEDVCCAGEESIHISPRTGLVMEVSYLCGFIITEAAIVQWIYCDFEK